MIIARKLSNFIIIMTLAFGMLIGISSSVSAYEKVPFSKENCKKIRFMSKGAQESISKKLNVSVSSISLYSVTGSNEACYIQIDTAKGIKDLDIYPYNGAIHTDGVKYWFHWNGI